MGHNEEIVHVQLIPELAWEEAGSQTREKSRLRVRQRPSVSAQRFVCIANDEHPRREKSFEVCGPSVDRVVSCEGFGAAMFRSQT